MFANATKTQLRRLALWALPALIVPAFPFAARAGQEPEYTSSFLLEDCDFKSMGVNPYFILVPGYRIVLEGEEDGEEVRVEEIVTNKTQDIFLEGIGKIRARIVRVREWIDGELAEDTRDFYAICGRTNAVFYFGEDVDNYEDGVIVNHDGTWRAGVDGALPGVIMPGTFLLGSRYFQEIAPGVALDRAEHTAMGLTVEVPAGTMMGCVEVLESTSLEPKAESVKIYAPGVGLVKDETLELVEFGYVALSQNNVEKAAEILKRRSGRVGVSRVARRPEEAGQSRTRRP